MAWSVKTISWLVVFPLSIIMFYLLARCSVTFLYWLKELSVMQVLLYILYAHILYICVYMHILPIIVHSMYMGLGPAKCHNVCILFWSHNVHTYLVLYILYLHGHCTFLHTDSTCCPTLLYSTCADQASVRSRAGLQVHDACRDGGQTPVGWSEECLQCIHSWHTSLTVLFTRTCVV